MLPKITLLVCILAYTTAILPPVVYPKYCSECEDEIWEEVPCDLIPTTTTTTTTIPPPTTVPPITPTPLTTTTVPPTPAYTRIAYTTTTTTLPPPVTTTTATTTRRTYYAPPPTVVPYNLITTTTTAPPAETTEVTGSAAFKKCYCECKVGCKEFCRKVIINTDPKQQITQISKTSESIGQSGAVEVTHLHERKYVPGSAGGYSSSSSSSSSSSYASASGYKQPQPNPVPPQPLPLPLPLPPNQSAYPVEASLELDSHYDPLKPIYNAPAPATVYSNDKPENYYANYGAEHDSGYTIDELTRLLHSEEFGKASYTNPSQIYYSHVSAPSYPYGLLTNKQYLAAPAPPVQQYPPNPAPTYTPGISYPPAPTPTPAPVTPAPQPQYTPSYAEVKPPVSKIIKTSCSSSSTSGVVPSSNYVSKSCADTPAPIPKTYVPNAPQQNQNPPAIDYTVNNYLKDFVYSNPAKPSSPGGYAPYHETSYSITYA